MRKNILIISFIFLFCRINATNKIIAEGFIVTNNTEIPIYTDSLTNEIKYVIFQDTIFEHFYELNIYEESSLRYKVEIQCVSQYNSPYIEGWIDKKNCGVFILFRRENKLFNAPNKDASYILIDNQDEVKATLISVFGEYIKVGFYLDKKYYEGWVKDYLCKEI